MNKTVFEYVPENTPANVDIIFQKIVLDLIECIEYTEYNESKTEFESILLNVRNWINDYVNNDEELSINKKELDKVLKQVEELDGKYLSTDGLYVEDLNEWMIQLSVVNIKGRGI